MGFFVGLILLTFIFINVSAELSCKDMNGADVDWFIALQIPQMKGHDTVHAELSKGLAFYYADSNNQNFRISTAHVNSTTSALGYTVSQAIQAIQAYKDKPDDTMYAFYNEQAPGMLVNGKETEEKDYDCRAHAKGLITFNNDQGFWLIHSVPRYPDPTRDVYFYPKKKNMNGQSFFCATFPSDQLKEIGIQIYHSFLAYYQSHLPASMFPEFTHLHSAIRMGKTVKKNEKYHRKTTLTTKGGEVLTNFAKSKKTQADLWANQVSAEMEKSFLVQTWLNTRPNWKNVCNGDIHTKNIRSINHESDGIQWDSSKDHSKWAVSHVKNTVCIGDINRHVSQHKRGGGCLCINNDQIWTFFRHSIESIECCEGNDPVDDQCHPIPCDSIDTPATNRKVGDPKREWKKPNKASASSGCKRARDEADDLADDLEDICMIESESEPTPSPKKPRSKLERSKSF